MTKTISAQSLGRRKRQEDAYVTNGFEHNGKSGVLTVICDGAGACPGGDVASTLVAHVMSSWLLIAALRGEIDDRRGFERVVNGALDGTTARLADTEAANPALKGLATTLSIVLLLDDFMYVANVGDSPIYSYRLVQDELIQLSVEQSRAVDLLAKGVLTAEDFETSPYRSQLTGYVSSDRRTSQKVAIQALTQPRRGRLMLCSDGVREVLGREGVRAMLCVERLQDLQVDLAAVLDEQADDNATAVVVEIESRSANATTSFPLYADSSSDAYCPACNTAANRGACFCDRCGGELQYPVDERCIQVGRRVIPLRDEAVVGRELFPRPDVARQHLRFSPKDDGQVWLEILSQAAPVWKRIDAGADVLCIGDVVRIGDNPEIRVL
ncbi:MAG: protein phosphatase 2C domain-containing protein [Planctomycetes bacterium]|nr:protein phosphatase 2C domain-containing protein [Planctomycetota bacterium]